MAAKTISLLLPSGYVNLCHPNMDCLFCKGADGQSFRTLKTKAHHSLGHITIILFSSYNKYIQEDTIGNGPFKL